jgi:Ner family transcriptional regulator
MPKLPEDYNGLRRGLRERGTSLSKIAGELDLTLPHVMLVARGDRRSPRVEHAIAQKFGVAPEALFPARYPRQAA